MVRAAGGVVERDGAVLLVHRPAYDDWSFPKGKLEDGETWEDAAVREVEEETGLVCTLGEELGRTHYVVLRGPKEVRYFRMASHGEPRAQNEVDEVRWATRDEARALLTHEGRGCSTAVSCSMPSGGCRRRSPDPSRAARPSPSPSRDARIDRVEDPERSPVASLARLMHGSASRRRQPAPS